MKRWLDVINVVFFIYLFIFWLLAKQSCQSPRLHTEDLKNACNTGPLNNIQQRHNALFDNCSLKSRAPLLLGDELAGRRFYSCIFSFPHCSPRAGSYCFTRTHKQTHSQTQTLRRSLVNQHWNFCLQGVFLWERDERV